MRYLSLFSGIEAASVAWQPLGWECVAVAEIELFPCSVLAHHYPTIPNLGDVTKITELDIALLGNIDLIVFGSPCQDLSVAGKRQGFTHADGSSTRSGLFYTAINIIQWARKHCNLRYALWENVPGAFSSNAGADFAAVVAQLAGMREQPSAPPKGWGSEGCAIGEEAMVEWSTLDAQYFGVAQRRRRVFVVADFGAWQGRPPILLERDSLRGDHAPRRSTGQEIASTVTASTQKSDRGDGSDNLIVTCLATGQGGAEITHQIAPTLSCNHEAPIAVYGIQGNVIGRQDQHGGNGFGVCEHIAPTLTTTDQHAVAIGWSEELTASIELAGTLQRGGSGGRHDGVMQPDMTVRRLTEEECEVLQGFPRHYTKVMHGKKLASGGVRYRALGNSMAVPVMAWIGQQIAFMEFFKDERQCRSQ
ncbi:DNA cytosine methyltransferase [Glaciimonas soli]|uniref:DNA (cytosine-5-)-methyltransferase n=1 Tax=Glaciimonas soli TaxID=2590999 RepID=A0A843Z0I5_9BURK|nr:DNA cytosine methyltransferase [Glaciimonas soli]MQR02346.1 DNA (cytosine-5-)-methyltransferase [Glaciimonas soli]